MFLSGSRKEAFKPKISERDAFRVAKESKEGDAARFKVALVSRLRQLPDAPACRDIFAPTESTRPPDRSVCCVPAPIVPAYGDSRLSGAQMRYATCADVRASFESSLRRLMAA